MRSVQSQSSVRAARKCSKVVVSGGYSSRGCGDS